MTGKLVEAPMARLLRVNQVDDEHINNRRGEGGNKRVGAVLNVNESHFREWRKNEVYRAELQTRAEVPGLSWTVDRSWTSDDERDLLIAGEITNKALLN